MGMVLSGCLRVTTSNLGTSVAGQLADKDLAGSDQSIAVTASCWRSSARHMQLLCCSMVLGGIITSVPLFTTFPGHNAT